MKKAILTLAFTSTVLTINAQIDANSLMGLPTATTAEMSGISGASIGQCLYNTDDNVIYYYNGSSWARATDDQAASEVNSDTPIDVDGDGNTESSVEDVIQDIAPITSASGRIFYPPSIAIDASSNGTNRTVNLYQQYLNQFGSGNSNLVRSMDGATPAPDIPVYAANELYYYVTYFDPLVFANISINGATGEMEYDIIGQPADYNSLINVVFVVK
ncbi:hypothetical protein L0P88_02265 [Muricauda sp. SCSIO 64092]|uniref:hypothetical protein n=1 Tax=Allomuricauda sp. SCSIO 64092 TaxID=2908842 RepID=UPI001FF30D7D|nr:hypothetical protein [Muricauda sp. SCSIO 64092]UOY07389.1 hypothetical protein L0P88_02265 [Muricauda sp. SCSIO 64092]